MSDQPDIHASRRNEDARMDRLETAIDKMGVEVSEIKVKIFNGFDKSIKSTESKVNYIDQRNREEHGALVESIKDLSKKFDKMLWFLITSSIGISGGVILAIVKDWI